MWRQTSRAALLPAAPPADAPAQENGEANGELKESAEPGAPKKCDVIVVSGRSERCESAVEALKVRPSGGALRLEPFHPNASSPLRLWFPSPSRWKCLLSFIATSSGRKEVEFAR